MLTIDQLDAKLIGLLTTDARAGIVELAATLGVTRNTVQSRIKRLEDTGLIRSFRPELNLALAGIDVQAFLALELELEQGYLSSVVAALRDIPEVLEIHATTGREDLLVRVATQDHASLQELIEKVLGIVGVWHSSTTVALTTPLPYRTQPLLQAITSDAGWGRSTPRA
ncbi:Lrp/AsnC family transcriptional regulator [Rhodococcus sp. PML026]|uniref:Lrp/AsnC family transcriptional regulator n=1 Tax=Rhodococcus sp. PML026 TaxID=1356405 RepID=UPI0005F7947B|nr:Lrp/AsnC family transcriptional regulator [Rhodococcus sp. PML026]KJV03682.1 putative AsnC family transcriptional regulator [Rhodococcus sp. PML026]